MRYYRRYNFQSKPMEDYEIREAYGGRRVAKTLVNVDIKVKGFVDFVVSSIGDSPAQDIRFEFSEGMRWWKDAGPPIPLKDGVRLLPPGRALNLIYNDYPDLLQDESDTSRRFEIRVSYFHPELDQRINEVFNFDLMDFVEAVLNESDIEIMTKKLVKKLKSLVNEAKKGREKTRVTI